MSTVPPIPGRTPGQRTLAAIVFTDVVGFSARMHADEMATLDLLQKDFAEMRRLCTEHEGSVLKTTGDGLLLTFTSAVQAVACALAMQRQFASDGRNQGPGEPLQHRIGIHLGDVVVQDEDVMGDGVNIAARLQSEAEPGGICISQTVYDVVRNKLEMQVVSLGARELKNIAQAVPVYRLLLAAQGMESAKGPFPRAPIPDQKSRGAWPYVAVAAVLVVGVAGVILWRNRTATPPVVNAPLSVPASAAVASAPASTEGSLSEDLSSEMSLRSDIQHLRKQYLEQYDFDGLVRALRTGAEKPGAPQGMQNMFRSAETLARFKSWLSSALARHSVQHPLEVQPLAGSPAAPEGVCLEADLRLGFVTPSGVVRRDWPDIKPAEMGAIVLAEIREQKDGAALRVPLLGAHVFARVYELPALTAALPAAKARQTKDAGSK